MSLSLTTNNTTYCPVTAWMSWTVASRSGCWLMFKACTRAKPTASSCTMSTASANEEIGAASPRLAATARDPQDGFHRTDSSHRPGHARAVRNASGSVRVPRRCSDRDLRAAWSPVPARRRTRAAWLPIPVSRSGLRRRACHWRACLREW